MVHRMVVGGAVALAGLLALAPPIEAFGRGSGAGAHAGFHNAVVPTFHRAVARVRSLPVAATSGREHAVRPGRAIAAFRLRRFAARRPLVRSSSGYEWPAATGDSAPYYGDYGAYAPINPTGTDDVAVDAPAAAPGGPVLVQTVPACRTQDYAVPDQHGERRIVRVLRC